MRARLASGSAGKLRELTALLGPRIVLAGPPAGWPAPEETGESFAANALLKAESLVRATGEAALADDSGLEVDALGGAPGVRSARYAADDEARVARLLGALAAVDEAGRGARFRCVLVLAVPVGRGHVVHLSASGTCEGRILCAPRGTQGFGYDPVFAPAGEARSFAELDAPAKDSRSHRGAAARELLRLTDRFFASVVDPRIRSA